MSQSYPLSGPQRFPDTNVAPTPDYYNAKRETLDELPNIQKSVGMLEAKLNQAINILTEILGPSPCGEQMPDGPNVERTLLRLHEEAEMLVAMANAVLRRVGTL